MLRSKDAVACDRLFEKYAGALYTFIDQVVPGTAQKNEILQEVFLTVYREIGAYDPSKGRLFTFILNITRKIALRNIRKGDQAIEIHEPNGLGKLMTKLDPEEKELLRLSWFKGYSVEQVAKKLNISPAVAKIKIRNSLLQLHSL